jgi:hypothetical protein
MVLPPFLGSVAHCDRATDSFCAPNGVQNTGGEATFDGDHQPILPIKVQSRLRAFALQLAGDSLRLFCGGYYLFTQKPRR